MKLARPDVFHPRIVLAGSPGGDDAGLVPALRARGLHARWLPWSDPGTLDADLIILRDAADHDRFPAWTTRVRNLLNAPDVVAWSMGRRHRQDLRNAGVPVWGRHASAAAHRTALVFLGGVPSHAFGRNAGLDADFELWDVGQAALHAAADHLGIPAEQLLYARCDVGGKPGEVALVDLDLVAPQLGWLLLDGAARDDAQRRFALCVESALNRLGLGPLAHRRP